MNIAWRDNSGDSVLVSHKDLMKVARCIGRNNPKPEINFLLADSEHMVSTDTRQMAIHRHNKGVATPFLVHGALIIRALSNKADMYELSQNSVGFHSDGIDIIYKAMSLKLINSYPDYKRIDFTENRNCESKDVYSAIEGIGFIVHHGFHIDSKCVPDIDQGSVIYQVNGEGVPMTEYPVAFKEENFTYIVQPIK